MNVLSLFDGMSCGRLALDRLDIKVDKYYASEIDKYAIQVSEANYPDIIRLGDVCDVKAEDLEPIDLIFAGQQLAFDDPRSALFFEFVRLLKECKPKYFLLENVKMKKQYLDVISEQVGVEPILINSALLSAQNRQRYYWTNIPNIEQPEDRGILLRDVLETESDEQPTKDTERNRRHYKTPDQKSLCMTATMYKGAGNNGMTLVPQRENLPEKSSVIKANYYKSSRANFENDTSKGGKFSATGVPMKPIKVGMAVEEVKVRKHEVDLPNLQDLLREAKNQSGKTNKQIAEETNLPVTKVEHWFRTDSSFAIPSDDVWFKLKEVLAIPVDTFDAQIMEFIYRDGVYESTQRVYSEDGKSPTLTASNSEQLIETKPKVMVRALTEQRTEESKQIRKDHRQRTGEDWSPRGGKELVPRTDGKMNTLTTSLTKSHTLEVTKLPDDVKAGAMRGRQISEDNSWTQQLETRDDGKTNSLTTVQKDNVLTQNEIYWRKLSPLECERLQTVPDLYTNHVSNTQRYKMLGNGWTIEVIAHLLKNITVPSGK